MTRSRLLIALLILTPPAQAEETRDTSIKVEFGNREQRNCHFVGSPLNFCSQKFTEAYEKAISGPANFNHDMVVIAIDTRPEYSQQTLVAVSLSRKVAFPFPFDFFSSSMTEGIPNHHGSLTYSLDSPRLCVDGEILAYRSTQAGHMCWELQGNQFVGEITPYTYPEH